MSVDARYEEIVEKFDRQPSRSRPPSVDIDGEPDLTTMPADDTPPFDYEEEQKARPANEKGNGHAPVNGKAHEPSEGAPKASSTKSPADPFAWLRDHEMTDEEAEQIADPTFIEPGFIVESHVVALVARPNGGKTTIMFHLACRWPQLGYQVVYVHADTNPADAKRMRELALARGVRYLTPDLKVGKGMPDVVEEVERLAASDTDLRGWVFIFDTLKKMTNVINKGALRELLALLRKLSARGMTVIVLAHTNKYKNAEGEYQFEGTNDLLADVDELIYFEPLKNPDGSITVSTRKEKSRATIVPMTWDIAPDLTVSARTDYLDVAATVRAAKEREEDAPVIEVITDCLFAKPKKQTEIIEHCRLLKFAERRVRRVLMTYSGELWKSEKQFQKNAWLYTRITRQECTR
jgi:hypothetical protein